VHNEKVDMSAYAHADKVKVTIDCTLGERACIKMLAQKLI